MSSESFTTGKSDILRHGNGKGPHAMQPTTDFVEYLKNYAREKPDVAALWCFGIGFVLGWKLKPW